MPTRMTPPLPLPEPLRGREEPSFTHYSVTVRLGEIAGRVLVENELPPEAADQIHTLIREIPYGAIRPLDIPLSPSAAEWEGYIHPYLGQNWLDVPWFFAEEYFYQRILEAVGYFHPGPGEGKDPFALQKRLGLETTRATIHALAANEGWAQKDRQGRRANLERMLLVDLWGNQNDLSMWPASVNGAATDAVGAASAPTEAAGASSSAEITAAKEHLLIDARRDVVEYLLNRPDGERRVDILVDNAGYELVTDLALADLLLCGGWCEKVVLHVKTQPVFVSDAMAADVRETLAFLLAEPDAATRALGERLTEALARHRLELHADSFWTSPLPAWEMPGALFDDLSRSHLVISKGDANYRRLLGDRHWRLETPFEQVMRYFPTALLALRTLKSEVGVGLPPDIQPTGDPKWLYNGRWGVIQFARGQS